MKPDKSSLVQQLQLVSRYESLRKILLSDRCSDDLDRPLADWVLPTDRRLPLALLGRTVGDLLKTPFEELLATRGIGRKKIQSLVRLLERVAENAPCKASADLPAESDSSRAAAPKDVSSNRFDPAVVSEVVWTEWRATVINRGLDSEPLGRLAPTLKEMTRVIWNKPLAAYANLTLAQIRGMKAHGRKRVRAILEAFHSVHSLVANMGTEEHLVVRVVPRLIDAVETWIGRALQTPGVPSRKELFENLIRPLLEQVRIDASEQIVRLAETRLGIHGPITSVRGAAREMKLTRARVYQLLNEVNDIMNVRWPLGRHQVYELRNKFRAEVDRMDNPPDLEQFNAAVELFYPGNRRGAAGALERAPQSVG